MESPVVTLVGVGGLGCPVALALAASGVALSLRLVDEDRVERSNLHRQVLFDDGDVGALKVEAAARKLRARWPGLSIETLAEHVAPDTAQRALAGSTLVIEGADNLPTKFLVADVAAAMGVSVVHGACVGWAGTVLAARPGLRACYRCVFEELPDEAEDVCNCATAGVWGPVTTVIGALMAADALRLLGGDDGTVGSLARYDGWRQSYRATRFARRAGCAACGSIPSASERPRLYGRVAALEPLRAMGDGWPVTGTVGVDHERYARQMALAEVGVIGQGKIAEESVAFQGLPALAGELYARAGGRIAAGGGAAVTVRVSGAESAGGAWAVGAAGWAAVECARRVLGQQPSEISVGFRDRLGGTGGRDQALDATGTTPDGA